MENQKNTNITQKIRENEWENYNGKLISNDKMIRQLSHKYVMSFPHYFRQKVLKILISWLIDSPFFFPRETDSLKIICEGLSPI